MDLNQLAAAIVQEATASEESRQESSQENQPQKNPAAVALGRLGGLKGGLARAKILTAKKRKEIAKKAAKARWESANKS